MSGKRKLVILAWAAVIAIAGLWPPWTGSEYASGCHFLFGSRYGRVDLARLAVEWIIITVIFATVDRIA